MAKKEEEEEVMETVIDKMVALIQERGEMSVRDVAKALGIGEPRVEELANVLDDTGLIKVRYTLTDVFLSPRKMVKEEREKVIEEARKKGELRRAIAELNRELSDSEKSFLFIQSDISKRLRRAEEMLGSIRRKEAEASEEDVRFVLKEAQDMEAELIKFSSEVNALRKQVSAFTLKVSDFELQTKAIAERKPKGKRKEGFLAWVRRLFGR